MSRLLPCALAALVLLPAGCRRPERCGAAVVGAPPRTIDVPRELARRSQFEASSVLWLPELDRYLLVSDDTGQPGADEDVAWVFTMDREGRLDPEPLPVEGLDLVIDLEASARGPGGLLYLLSSQSATSRGVRPVARTLLVRARLGPGRRLVLEAARSLLTAIAAAAEGEGGEAWLAELCLGERLPEIRSEGSDLLIDVEGLALTDGGLLLGLKEPLLPTGAACLWRLARPDAFLESGRIERGDLRRYSSLPLTVQTELGPVSLGVSGLAALPDGALAVTSTVPGQERFHLGALWIATGLPDAPAVRLVRAFPGLKPEGVAPSPHAGRLAVVFDAGGGFPLWIEIAP